MLHPNNLHLLDDLLPEEIREALHRCDPERTEMIIEKAPPPPESPSAAVAPAAAAVQDCFRDNFCWLKQHGCAAADACGAALALTELLLASGSLSGEEN